ncbi:MAG: glycerophosphodiester phosphodiesterase [Deltaproteobacteria bacterium]|nr:glycerophosphodiester phosphodiesterase [Deltaproteobacteria bacterium]
MGSRPVLLALALAALPACGGGATAGAPGFLDGPLPRVIAHRGGADLAPESTLAGFESGLANGAQILETDAHTTRDGVVVLLHDDTVDRTTDGTGAIHDLTLAEVKSLDAGYRFTRDGGATFPYRGTGVTIPTLDEVLDRFPRERFLIEIKQTNPPIEADVIAAIERHGISRQVCLASFVDTVVRRVRDLAPDLCTSASVVEVVGLVVTPLEQLAERGVEARATQFPFDVLGVPLVSRELVDKHHALDLEIHVWTVDAAADMASLLDLGVDGIITDRPDTLAQVIGDRR